VSTALMVTLNGPPAVSFVGVPVFPLAVPGAAISPGTSSCNLANAPGLTATDELVFEAMPPWVTSEPVTLALAAVFSVTLKVFVPATNAEFAGSTALASLDVTATTSLVLIRFQFASTAFTVTLNALPAIWLAGLPDLPLVEPGAAVSPGSSVCNLAKAPVVTEIEAVVLELFVLSEKSFAVTVELPAVRNVTLKDCVPFTSTALAGSVAFASEDVMRIVSVAADTTFQLASTALTVRLNALPAARGVGEPVFPLSVPGAAVSPGARICNFVNAPAETVSDGLVLNTMPE
jgi:hypothetical protein